MVIWLTNKPTNLGGSPGHGKPNAFGIGYMAWFFNLKGPTFMVVREKSDG